MASLRHRFQQPAAWLGWLFFGLSLGLILLRNQPWHLDDKDQAKQAFIAVEIIQSGADAWWFQHTPDGQNATKPPLMGWLNTALRWLGLPWDWAWRLPGILAAAWLLWAIWQRGKHWGTGWIAWAGMACFGFNLLTPRLGGLVRTDMLLAACCGWAVLVIYDDLRAQQLRLGQDADASFSWQKSHCLSWKVVLALSLAAMLKGPVAWVFLLPGALLFGLIGLVQKRRGKGLAGVRFPLRWWAWLLPLGPFVAWALAGIAWQEGFYEEVFLREFLARFEGGEQATHNSQHLFFYLLQLSKALAPWVLLLILLSCLDVRIWKKLLQNPSLLWLGCAFLGAFLFMSAIPSKRLDRIYPALVPLALLVPALLAQFAGLAEQTRLKRSKGKAGLLAALTSLLAAATYASYSSLQVRENWPQSAAFNRYLRDEARADFARWGIDLAAGEVASLENDYEALFVWLPEVVALTPEELKLQAKESRQAELENGEIRAVFALEKQAKKLNKTFPEAELLQSIPSPQEAKNQQPLQLWLLSPPNTSS